MRKLFPKCSAEKVCEENVWSGAGKARQSDLGFYFYGRLIGYGAASTFPCDLKH